MNKYTTVTEFMSDLDPAKRLQVESLRAIIKDAHPGLDEHIKWNAPSYVLDGEDRVTFNLLNKENTVQLVLHMGATRAEDKKGEPVMPDHSGLINWRSDTRGVLNFESLDDIASKQAAVTDIITRWLLVDV